VGYHGSAFPDLVLFREDSIPGPGRTEITALLQQEGVDLRGGQIHESLRREQIQDPRAFGV
jgi:hypothetical protein